MDKHKHIKQKFLKRYNLPTLKLFLLLLPTVQRVDEVEKQVCDVCCDDEKNCVVCCDDVRCAPEI